jgi:hypothetical protein
MCTIPQLYATDSTVVVTGVARFKVLVNPSKPQVTQVGHRRFPDMLVEAALQ